MCAGPQFFGPFQNCTCQASAVYAVHGAAVTLRRCVIRDSHPGLILAGSATSATLAQCVFQDCCTCIAVDRGAAAAAASCVLQRTRAAVTVHGLHSHVSLDSCAVSGGSEDGYGRTGVAARGGSALLRHCELSGCHTGVLGTGGTTSIELHLTVVTGGSTHAVKLIGGARGLRGDGHLNVADGLCAGASAGPDSDDEEAAVVVDVVDRQWLGGACMQLQQTSVYNKRGRGVAVTDGSAADMSLCKFEASRQAVHAWLGSSATLSHCRCKSLHSCIFALESAKVRVVGGRYEGSSTAGCVKAFAVVIAVDCELRARSEPMPCGILMASYGSVVWLLRCYMHGGAAGVTTTEEDVTVHAIDTIVSDMLITVPQQIRPQATHDGSTAFSGAGYCLAAAGGRVTVRGGHVERCGIGLATHSSVEAEGVEVIDCTVGMVVDGQSEVEVARGAFKALRRTRGSESPADVSNDSCRGGAETGVVVRGHARCALSACTFKGYGLGLFVTSPGGVVVSGSRFEISGECAWGILASQNVTVEGFSFVGSGKGPDLNGVKALRRAECVIRRCSMHGLRRDSITADAQSSGSMRVFITIICDGGTNGLAVSGEGSLTAQDCQLSVAGRGVFVLGGVFSGRRVNIQARDTGVVADPSPGAVAEVKLEDSAIDGGLIGVFADGATLAMSLLRCHVSECFSGVILRGGASAQITGCNVTQCWVGVQVGDSEIDLAEDCDVCHCKGDETEREAVRLLSDHGGASVVGPGCAHAGAVTHARMAQVEFRACRHDGVVIHPHGHLHADEVSAWHCGAGFRMHYIAVRSEFWCCKAVECDVGTVALQQLRHAAAGVQPPAQLEEIRVFGAVVCGEALPRPQG